MKKKTIVIVILCISVLIVLLLIFMKNRKTENPVIVELQKQITEQVGSEFQMPEWLYYEEAPITSITFDAKQECFLQEDIFIKVNLIQEIVYRYVRENDEYFQLEQMHYGKKDGFDLYIDNVDEVSRDQTVFTFSNYIQNEEKISSDYVSLHVSAEEWVGVDAFRYPYKISNLKELKGVREIASLYFEIDDVDALGEVKDLKYFYSNALEEDYKKIEKAATKYGIFLK